MLSHFANSGESCKVTEGTIQVTSHQAWVCAGSSAPTGSLHTPAEKSAGTPGLQMGKFMWLEAAQVASGHQVSE